MQFPNSGSGSDMTYRCRHNSSRSWFPYVWAFLAFLCITYITIIDTVYIYWYIKPKTPLRLLNPLTPNDHYSGRTVPLTSKVAFYIFIQQIQVLNILNMTYTLRFFLFKLQFVS